MHLQSYTQTMVKKLRSGDVKPLKADITAKPISRSLPTMPVTSHAIRRQVSKKLAQRRDANEQKANKFQERATSGQLGSLVDSANLECAFCLELLVMPVTMACGHVFCRRCLEANTAHSSNCCLCRHPSAEDEIVPCPQVETLINKFIVPNQQDSIQYLCRVTEAHEWLARRTLQHLKTDQIVDFRDSMRTWRRAKVMAFTEKQGKTMVELKLANRSADMRQTVEVTSKRIAPAFFFTRKRYLEDYGPSLMGEYERIEDLQNFAYLNAPLTEEVQQCQAQPCEDQGSESQEGGYFDEPSQESVSLDGNLALFNYQMNHLEELLF